MENRYTPGALADIDLRFDNRSITPSIGYTDERGSRSDGFVNMDSTAKTVRLGLDGETSLGPVDLQGSASAGRTRSNINFTDPSTGASLFSNPNVGTFTKIGIGARIGAFSLNAERQKRTGSDANYYGTVGMNIGENSRLQYSDSNTGTPTVGFNYRMDF